MKTLKDYAGEIVLEASIWWNATGRHLVPNAINDYTPPPSVRTVKGGPVFVSKAATIKDINSGILLMKPWADLTKDEQKQVFGAYLKHTWLPAHPEFQQEPQGASH